MKSILKYIIITIFLLFSSFSFVSWSDLSELLEWWSDSKKLDIECVWKECNLKTWIEQSKDIIDGVETERTFSEYIQDIVVYILWFLSIIAVIFIIYAWFTILTWAWDEEKLKTSKKTIIYVVIWMIVIWSAYSIVLLIIDWLKTAWEWWDWWWPTGPVVVDMT